MHLAFHSNRNDYISFHVLFVVVSIIWYTLHIAWYLYTLHIVWYWYTIKFCMGKIIFILIYIYIFFFINTHQIRVYRGYSCIVWSYELYWIISSVSVIQFINMWICLCKFIRLGQMLLHPTIKKYSFLIVFFGE